MSDDLALRYLVIDLGRIFEKHFRDTPTVADDGSPFMAFIEAVWKEMEAKDGHFDRAAVLRIAREQGFAEET